MVEKKAPARKTPVTKKFKVEVDADLIRELAALVAETGLSEIELGEGDHRVRVVAGGGPNAAPTTAPAAPPPADSIASAATAAPAGPPPGAVSSPMVGTVFTAPEPGSPPFVSVGDTVAKGDNLFIIEAMKVMNPIRSPRAGTVLEILVEDGGPVEFGETLLVLG